MIMNDQFTFFLTTLENAGLRLTEQRRVICRYLAGSCTHPTASELFAALSQQHPDMSRATVYNTLNTLKELGAIAEISFGGDHSRFETDITPHINLICLRCHRIIDLENPMDNKIVEEYIRQASDFQPVSLRVDVLGFCADCRQRRRDEIRQQMLENPHQLNQTEIAGATE
jgi:Fur family peroxide stress response transcriptional regulator